MSINDIEAEVLKLDPQVRARLAKNLLQSLQTPSDEENEHLWAEEADPSRHFLTRVTSTSRSPSDRTTPAGRIVTSSPSLTAKAICRTSLA